MMNSIDRKNSTMYKAMVCWMQTLIRNSFSIFAFDLRMYGLLTMPNSLHYIIESQIKLLCKQLN